MNDWDSPPLILDKILFATDLSGEETNAFVHALRIALGAQSELHIVHFEPDLRSLDWEDFPHVRSTLQAWKQVNNEDLDRTHVYVQKAFETGSSPVKQIVDYIEEREIDLLVVSTHQRKGLDRFLHTSVAEPIARRSKVSSLFVPLASKGFVSSKSGRVALKTILIPVAANPPAREAIVKALGLAGLLDSQGVRLVLLYVGNRADYPIVEVMESEHWTVERKNRQGDVVKEIVAVAGEIHADLVVMVTEGHVSLLDAITGDTTERVLRSISCPLLAVRNHEI